MKPSFGPNNCLPVACHTTIHLTFVQDDPASDPAPSSLSAANLIRPIYFLIEQQRVVIFPGDLSKVNRRVL
ncbi:MAG: hypothetical protein OSA08_00090 [Arenicellales bacterium]|nr:hypothetical protein [Arenicellales bacterium]